MVVTEKQLSQLMNGIPGALKVINYLTAGEIDWCIKNGFVGSCLWVAWKDVSNYETIKLHKMFEELTTSGKCERLIRGQSKDVLEYVKVWIVPPAPPAPPAPAPAPAPATALCEWSVDEVAGWLRTQGLSDAVLAKFTVDGMVGSDLVLLTAEDMKGKGVHSMKAIALVKKIKFM
jgi:hypothetical protein